MGKLTCITYNVNGIAGLQKRMEVFRYLHDKKVDLVFLQETHSVKEQEKFWSTKWGTKI